MSLSKLVRDFTRHTSSIPPRSYFGGPIHVPGIDEDPWEGVPAHEMERVRLRLLEDSARRQQAAEQRDRASAAMRRALAGRDVVLG